MMDSLVLALATVTIGVNTERAGVTGDTRRALETTTDGAEVLFMQMCAAVRDRRAVDVTYSWPERSGGRAIPGGAARANRRKPLQLGPRYFPIQARRLAVCSAC
jgi:hypothetical protein